MLQSLAKLDTCLMSAIFFQKPFCTEHQEEILKGDSVPFVLGKFIYPGVKKKKATIFIVIGF